jgi:hypothetical protein
MKDIGFIKWSKEAYEYEFDTGQIIIQIMPQTQVRITGSPTVWIPA